jgi:hypothetical protein
VVRADGSDGGEERVLRAKYLDWCSARVAERFLELTPDEIYELAQRASYGADPDPGRRASGSVSPDAPDLTASPAFLQPSVEEPESFRRIVEIVTQALTRDMSLPDFEAWRTAYEAAPEAFDDDLLGLWRESV